ncbi:hypothetical protein [Nitrospirillum amazonense]|uniref:Hsp20/alpha crystallin family protein n=1 Tax=Nitrospirillum amazonense TaxID=28077 RepID=A0A560JGS8_9PROT|nr:hypothetical protein [Nitrospirillum amazonense]MDG3439468.1 hypothetical protein [Nitrospirillum amazonense]TWB69739.1 hypothetical protein FBZ87_10829 [Nitrospirillum amazonense]
MAHYSIDHGTTIARALGSPAAPTPATAIDVPATDAPAIDIVEAEEALYIITELPEDVLSGPFAVTLKDRALVLWGPEVPRRRVPLPFRPDPRLVRTEFRRGVMTVTVPKGGTFLG